MAEKDTSRLLIFTGDGCGDRMAQWLEAALFSLEEVGMRVQIPAWQPPFFFLSSFFHTLAFYFLFSLLTLLASRDFCENVFLVEMFELNERIPGMRSAEYQATIRLTFFIIIHNYANV